MFVVKMKLDIKKQLGKRSTANPNADIWLLINKGWILTTEGKYDAAIKAFNKSLSVKIVPSA